MGIYLDNAATTYVYPEVLEVMKTYYRGDFFNPSAGYGDSRRVREDINAARKTIADIINAEPEEIFFTSGGTESDNWVCNEAIKRGGHIITSTIEHKAMLMPISGYTRKNLIPPDEKGLISIEKIRRAIRNDTVLVSIMTANNEIGTIQPIKTIGEMLKEYGIMFHTDAVQAFAHIPIDVKRLQVDLLSASAHKFHGPKGCGFLYASKETGISPFIAGGGQEFGKRAGTENVAGIVGMAYAADISVKRMKKDNEWLLKIRDYITGRIFNEIEDVRINGDDKSRLSNNMNFSFKNVDGSALLVMLEIEGIYASGGSACNVGNKMSYVLKEINVPKEYIGGSIRLTTDAGITVKEADYVVYKLKQCVKQLREKSKPPEK